MDRETLLRLADDCERAAAEAFRRIDRTAAAVTAKVMEAFRRNRLSASHFAGGSGYGYDDLYTRFPQAYCRGRYIGG